MTPHLSAHRLRTNGLEDPSGIDDDELRLAWDHDGGASAFLVEAWVGEPRSRSAALLVASTLDTTARNTVIRRPDGVRSLSWRVGALVDGDVAWSGSQTIRFALDFESAAAHWITHPEHRTDSTRSVWFRHRFERNAHAAELVLLHLACVGVCEVRVDGRELGARVLAPGYARLDGEAAAISLDLSALDGGPHTLTIEVAAGPYLLGGGADRYTKFRARSSTPRIAAVLEHVTHGQSVAVERLDESTVVGRGPTIASHWYGGEDIDAALPEPVDDPLGTTPLVLGPSTLHRIWWPQSPAIEIAAAIDGAAIARDEDSVTFDFSVNIAGFPELAWPSPDERRRITLWPAERIIDGALNQASTGSPIFDSVTTLAGEPGRWRPRFGYHGFRYLRVDGAGSGATARALVAHTSNTRVGSFTSSDSFLQRLDELIVRSIEGNMYSVFTDCPHREKLGWLEQLHLCFGALAGHFDVEAHLRSVLHHVRAAQLDDGAIPNIAPEFVDFSGNGAEGDPDAFRFDVNWGGVIVLLPLHHFVHYGDPRILRENASAMVAYLDHLASREHDGVIEFGLSDWVSIDGSAERRLVATYGYWRVLRAAQRIARLLGRAEWEAVIAERLTRTQSALARWPYADTVSQSDLALLTDVADQLGDHVRADELFSRLVAAVDAAGNAFTVGEIGFEPLVDAFHRRGLDARLHEVFSRQDVPGYGMQLAKGMTALAETWSAESGPEGEGSNNHFMLGMVSHWMTGNIAGLRQAPGSVGWARAEVEPVFLPGVQSVEYRLDSPAGRYGVSWRRTERDTAVELTVTVPGGGSAVLLTPDGDALELGPGVHETVLNTPLELLDGSPAQKLETIA